MKIFKYSKKVMLKSNCPITENSWLMTLITVIDGKVNPPNVKHKDGYIYFNKLYNVEYETDELYSIKTETGHLYDFYKKHFLTEKEMNDFKFNNKLDKELE